MLKKNHVKPSAVRELRTHNTLPESVRTEVCVTLHARLADAVDLFTMIKHAHWNVRGHGFIGLHKLFDEIASEAVEWGDMIAERARQLGAAAPGTSRMVAAKTSLEEYPVEVASSAEHVEILSERLAAFGELVREAIDKTDDEGDPATADMFTEICRAVDEALWFVESNND